MAETGATVPFAPPYLSRAGVLTGRPVRGGAVQVGALGLAANHLHGRGNALIPWAFTNSLFTKNGTITLRFKVWPQKSARRRVWFSVYKRAVSTTATSVTFTDPSGGTHLHRIPAGAAGTLFRHTAIEDVATPGGSEEELAPTWAETSNSSAPYLYRVACVEGPRTDLELNSDARGVVLSSLVPTAAVYTTTGVGIGAIATSLNDADSTAQRAGLFAFARGANDYLSTTSASLVSPFYAEAELPLLGRKRYRTSTTATVKVRARCSAGATTEGEVVFTMTSGDTLTLTITSGMSSAWLSGDLDINCDDLTEADGLPGGVLDKCVVEWRRTSGANSIFLESLCIGNG